MAAGLGFIEFTTGDVLTAAAANGYLASQVVMVFADSTARTAAIASPQEGMISFLKDTNAVEAYDGAAWVSVGGGSAGFVGARAFVSTSQIVNNSTTAFAAFTSESYDTDAFHDNVTNNSRFTIPSGKDGKYLITANMHLANPGSTTGNVNVQIIKNASTVLARAEINGFSFIPNILNLVDIQDLVATDYLRVQVFQDLGANVSISSAGTSGTYLAISYLGA